MVRCLFCFVCLCVVCCVCGMCGVWCMLFGLPCFVAC